MQGLTDAQKAQVIELAAQPDMTTGEIAEIVKATISQVQYVRRQVPYVGIVASVSAEAYFYPTGEHQIASVKITATLENGLEILVGHVKRNWRNLYVAAKNEDRLKQAASALIGQEIQYDVRKSTRDTLEKKTYYLMKARCQPEALRVELRPA